MHSVIQIFLLLPIFIITTTTTNTNFDSDTNDVIVRKPTSSYSAPLPYPLTTPSDTVPEMNRKSCFELATTTLADTYKHAWYLRKRGKVSEGNSKEIKEKDGDSSNDDNRIKYPDQYPYDVCFSAHFSKDFSGNSERDWILRRYCAIIDKYCDNISVSLTSYLIFHLPDRLPVSPLPLTLFVRDTNVALSQNQTTTIVPSAPLAEWVSETPTTKLLAKRMVKVGYVILMLFIVASLVELQPRPTLAARMPTLATRRGRVPPIVGSVVLFGSLLCDPKTHTSTNPIKPPNALIPQMVDPIVPAHNPAGYLRSS